MTELEEAKKRIEELENGLKSIGGYILVYTPRDAVDEIEKIVEWLVGDTTSDSALETIS